MTNVKISQLPLATSPLDSTVEMPVVQGGVTKRAPVNTIGVEGGGTVQSALNVRPITVLNIAALRLLTAAGPTPSSVFTLGYYAATDGGGGCFIYDASDTTSADNHGTIIVDAAGRRWKRQLENGALNRRMFGAKLDPFTTDDTVACQRMLAAANNPAGNLIQIEPGQALITDTLTIAQPVKMIGPGAQYLSTGIPYAEWVFSHATKPVFDITHSRASTFKDFSIRHVTARTAGDDFRVTGAVGEQPIHLVWDNITTLGSHTVINMTRGAKHWKVTNCTFAYGANGAGVGIFFPSTEFPDSGDNSVHGNSFISFTREVDFAKCGFAAIYLESSFGMMITGNKFFGGLNGLVASMKAGTGNLQISANSFEQIEESYISITQGGASGGGGNITISGNEFSKLDAVAGGGVDTTAPGIFMHSFANPNELANISITGNVFNSSYLQNFSEIAIFSGDGVAIVGNTFRFYDVNVFGAIQTAGNATNVVIADNAFAQMTTNMHYNNGLNSSTKVLGDTLTAAQLGAWADGSLVLASDGTPGNPLTGGGSGALAVRRGGVWVGL
jgi:hypothetical protein